MDTVELTCCAGCKGFFAGHAVRNSAYYCPKCWDRRTAGFDPVENDRVRLIDRMTGPFSDLFVVSRDGDAVTVQVIGCPDRRFTTGVRNLVRG